jgi:hypothetical protein
MRSSLLLPLLLLGCRDKAPADTGGALAWRPDLVCPGDAGCASNEGFLHAGFGSASITPTCFEGWEDVDGNAAYSSSTDAFLDCGCDRVCSDDPTWTGADEGEADGVFQASWIAGFGQARAANGVHDELLARAVALESGDVRVVLLSLDTVGLFYDQALEIEAAVAAEGVEVDRIIVSSTHSHEVPDTLGQWGRRVGESGVDADHLDYLVRQAAAAVVQAVGGLTRATLRTASVDTAAPFGSKGTRNLVRDSRDPVVIEEQLHVAWFTDQDGASLGSVVNWGNHPEVLSSDNLELSADFVWSLREAMEQGVAWESGAVEGLGGTSVFLQGMVGGLMTPLGVTTTDMDGVDHSGASFETAEAFGKTVATLAIEGARAAAPVDAATVSVRGAELYVPVENVAFQALFLIGTFERALYHYDPEEDLDEENQPEVKTRMDLVQLGPISMLTVPGELDPEVFLGGADGSRVNSDEVEFIESTNPNPPDMSLAPAGPYLVDQMSGDHRWVIGLASDELGYLLAPYNYQLSETSPYLAEAEGDHYEETNSVGPAISPLVIDLAERLILWTE